MTALLRRFRRNSSLGVVLAASLFLGTSLAGCGDDDDDDDDGDDNNDDNGGDFDAGDDGGDVDAGPDGGGGLTFADFVIDLIENQTADNTEPVAIDFSLPDDEAPDSFDSLF